MKSRQNVALKKQTNEIYDEIRQKFIHPLLIHPENNSSFSQETVRQNDGRPYFKNRADVTQRCRCRGTYPKHIIPPTNFLPEIRIVPRS